MRRLRLVLRSELRRVAIVAIVLAALCVAASAADEKGLVAHWDFNKGKGNVLHDKSGNKNDGRIYGAAWVKGTVGTALQFDGKDDYVDCGAGPSLNVEKAATVVLWFKPEALQGGLVTRSTGMGWTDQRLVIAFLTYFTRKLSLLGCLASGKTYWRGDLPLPPTKGWSHLAMTFDARNVKVYLDTVLVTSTVKGFEPKFADVPLLIGKCQGLGKQFFKGLIDEVRIYNRALTQAEVEVLYKAEAEARGKDTLQFLKPRISTTIHPQSGRLLVSLDYRLMRSLPAGATFDVAVFRAGGRKALQRGRMPTTEKDGGGELILDLQGEPPGKLAVRAQARKASGQEFGLAASEEIEWPERDPRFSPKKGVKVLNNFVFELLTVELPGEKEFTIHNPREGWIFISASHAKSRLSAAKATIFVDRKEVPLRLVDGNYEAMRYLPEGAHTIRVGKGIDANKLIVRAMGELFYSMYGSNPLVPETGNYTWQWLRKHVLDHYNCIIGQTWPYGSRFKYEKELREWVSHGKRWYSQRNLPWNVRSGEEACKFWAGQMGMQHPLMHGIWVDEFSVGAKFDKMYPIWCDGIRRLKADPRLRGRQFYAYSISRVHGELRQLVKTIAECRYRFAPEWYLRERFTEEQVKRYFDPTWSRVARASFEPIDPEAANSRVLILSLASQPEESSDIYPHCNYNVFLDMQFQFIATEPAYFGLRGLQGYYSPYAGEEQIRLFAKLLRHYAIEGRTDRMLTDPYILTHLENPDFLQGTAGWTLSPSDPPSGNQPSSIAAKTAKGFGWLQGRYIQKDVGDTVLWTRRSANKPNSFSQSIRDLEPGRLYSLRFFTGNCQDLLQGKSRSYKHAISVQIENVELIPGKEFQAIIQNCYAHTFGPFNRHHRYWMNYHQRVFRAKGNTARLVLSDWSSADNPGDPAPAGEELIWNFIQVQPYFEEH